MSGFEKCVAADAFTGLLVVLFKHFLCFSVPGNNIQHGHFRADASPFL